MAVFTISGSVFRSNLFERNLYRHIAANSGTAKKEFAQSVDLLSTPFPTFPIAISTQAATTINFLIAEVINGTATIRLSKNGAYTGNPAVSYIANEVPSGLVNGTNNIFTLDHAPVENTEQVFVEGLRKIPGIANDYIVDGSSIIFNVSAIPQTNETIVVDYYYNTGTTPIPLQQQDLDLNVSGTLILSGIDINKIYVMGVTTPGCYINFFGTGN